MIVIIKVNRHDCLLGRGCTTYNVEIRESVICEIYNYVFNAFIMALLVFELIVHFSSNLETDFEDIL